MSLVPLEAKKEEQAIKEWIYRGEADEEDIIVTTPISPKQYGKGYKILLDMGYQGHESLTSNKKALVEPLSHTQGHDTVGLEFKLEDNIPTFAQNAPISSESEDDDPSFFSIT